MEKKNNEKYIRGIIATVENTIHFESGHSIDEWNVIKAYAEDLPYDLWDFSIDDLINGAIEPDKFTLYWLIDGRLYETLYPSNLNCD